MYTYIYKECCIILDYVILFRLCYIMLYYVILCCIISLDCVTLYYMLCAYIYIYIYVYMLCCMLLYVYRVILCRTR